MCAAVQEASFLRPLVQELFIAQVKAAPIAEYNQICSKLFINPVFHKKSKHMLTKLYYNREKIEDVIVEKFYQATEEMAVDIFTKPLGR